MKIRSWLTLAVMAQAQRRKQEAEEVEQQQKEALSGDQPSPVGDEGVRIEMQDDEEAEEPTMLGGQFADDLFSASKECVQLT